MALDLKNKLQNLYNRLPLIGRYAEVPAGWIDHLDLEESSSFISKLRLFIFKRVIFLLFPILAAVDVLTSLIGSTIHFIGALFTSDDTQTYHLHQVREYTTLFSKSLLGVFFSPLGLISPKLVSFFFIPAKNSNLIIQSGGSLYSTNAEITTPKSKEELQQLIKTAYEHDQQVMVMGAGRSQGPQFLPHPVKNKISMVVDLSNFKSIKINKETNVATIGAGARWVDLQLAANHENLALKVMQASNVFSVGGSISTNIHGWNHRDGSLGNVIRSLTIINPKGEEQVITPNDKAEFAKIIGGFGLFGVIISADIELTDNEELEEQGSEVSIDNYIQYFKDNIVDKDNIRMHLFRLSIDPDNLLIGNGIAVNYTQKANSPTAVRTKNIKKEGESGTRIERIMVNIARRFPFARKLYWQGEQKRLIGTTSTMTTNEIMQPPINAMFNKSASQSEWLQEYFLPAGKLAAFIKELAQILRENEVILLNSSVRFVKKDKHPSLLSYAIEDRFAVVLCFNQFLKPSEVIKTKKWVREANNLAIKHGGTFYLPYQQFASPEQFEQAYGKNINQFQSAKTAADPKTVFNSGFYQQYLAPKMKRVNYFKELMSCPDTKKKFEGFLENVLQRVDVDKLYTLLEDIMQYNDTHEEIYSELLRRLPEVMPGAIGSLRRILASLTAIKEDLTAQAKALMPGVEKINGLVEIGYPGRFVAGFKSKFTVTGTITAVYEAPSVTDYIQSGFPRPYDKFVPLNYDAPDLSAIADNSADVITCYVGLHHFPENKLDQFLHHIRRILRPNGRFLLVDHDANDKEAILMAHMAHSIFNAVNGVSLEEEMKETRNFRPLREWQRLLTKHNLAEVDSGPSLAMIRKGDPSRNTMVSFINPGLDLNANPMVPLLTTTNLSLNIQMKNVEEKDSYKQLFVTSLSNNNANDTVPQTKPLSPQ